MNLTKEVIKKEQSFTTKLIYGVGFSIIGISLSIMPMFYLQSFDANTIIAVVFCTLCFGIPFGFIWGIRKTVVALKQLSAINNDAFSICIDKVNDMRMLSSGIKTGTRDSYCQLEFENYTNKTGKCITVRRKVFDKTKKGDEFYLVYLGDIKNTISVFSTRTYKLSNDLHITN